MSLVMSEDSKPKYPTIPLGVQKARCISVIDLGTQENNWQGETSGNDKYCLNGKFQNILIMITNH